MRAAALPLPACLLGLLLSTAAFARASDPAPVAVAPGAAPGLGVVETRCPTFHWTAVASAAAYEIVVLEADADGTASAATALRAVLPAAATGWTPSLEQCLHDDADYLWSIRARHGRGWGEWSEPGLFQVRARRPDTGDADESLVRRVVREILEEERLRGNRPLDVATIRSPLDTAAEARRNEISPPAGGAAPTTGDRLHPTILRTEQQTTAVANAGLKATSTNTVDSSAAILGETTAATGFVHAVKGTSASSGGPAIYGRNSATTSPAGLAGGVRGDAFAPTGLGVYGLHSSASGVGVGVRGDSTSPAGYGVLGVNANTSGQGVGVFGRSASSTGAGGYFVNSGAGALIVGNNGTVDRFYVTAAGNVFADGSYNCGASISDAAGTLEEAEIEPCLKDDSPADFAEMLPAAKPGLEPGDVLALTPDGELVASEASYQTTVIGVVSTRPSYLGNNRFAGREDYAAVALVGVVPVKVTDQNGPIRAGDLLVSSSRPGHAMRAGKNPPQGSVIGKALSRLDGSSGIVTMVAMLQ